MDPNKLADTKAHIKRAIAEQLAALPLQARADVLADLRLALSEDASSSHEPHRANGVRSVPSKQRRGARRRQANQNTEGTKTAQIIATLKAHPRMPIADLAQAIYPNEEHGIRRLRQALFGLKRQGRVNNPKTGAYEVTE